MANLTETAYLTRQSIKWGSIGLGVFLILRLVWGVVDTYWQNTHPAPPPPPTVAFGKIKPIVFPAQEGLPKISYRLETIEGTTPSVGSQGKVYFIPKPVASLLALDRARLLAGKLGFSSAPTQVSERIYRFSGQNTETTLEMDIISQKFKMTYDFINDQSVLAEKKLPSNEQAISEAKNFLRQIDLLSDDLAAGEAKVSYFRLITPDLVPAISLSEADFVRIDLFRAPLDDYAILPPKPNVSQISFLFSGSRDNSKRIVEVDYSYNSISLDKYATYPLRTSDIAWQEFSSGQGFVAHLGENEDGQVIIRKVYLAYFESENLQDFLQPIYVFEGDRNFVGYLPALDKSWIE